MKYEVYEQRIPKRVQSKWNPEEYHWEANLFKVGEVDAEDSDEAFKKAKRLTIKPVLESDASLMIAREERAIARMMGTLDRYS